MIYVGEKYFDMAQICKSGQCFRMREISDGVFEVIAGDRYLRVRCEKTKGYWFDIEQEEYDTFWKHYFSLDEDYKRYVNAVDPADAYLNKALSIGSGIRILNQDLWEMMVSFLISQQNNITRIRKCIDNISRKYGSCCTNKYGEEYYAFPTPEQLSLCDEDELMGCNLGYRSKYVVRLANSVRYGKLDLGGIDKLTYDEAKARLLEVYGIGNKVADCICLFALHHIDAFPIDTHIRQVLDNHYANGFPFERYEGFAGVIQQYMFYYEIEG